jgi:prepilin-type N-terminal cleavage/methylation domain-containing protein
VISSLTRSHQRGFSMLEVLLTAFILGVALLGLTALQTITIKSNTNSRNRTTAVLSGQAALEAISMEGILSKNAQSLNTTLPTPKYVNTTTPIVPLADPNIPSQFSTATLFGEFNNQGALKAPAGSAPASDPTIFEVRYLRIDNATVNALTQGRYATFYVYVRYLDGTLPDGVTPNYRTLTLKRVVGYA